MAINRVEIYTTLQLTIKPVIQTLGNHHFSIKIKAKINCNFNQTIN